MWCASLDETSGGCGHREIYQHSNVDSDRTSTTESLHDARHQPDQYPSLAMDSAGQIRGKSLRGWELSGSDQVCDWRLAMLRCAELCMVLASCTSSSKGVRVATQQYSSTID